MGWWDGSRGLWAQLVTLAPVRVRTPRLLTTRSDKLGQTASRRDDCTAQPQLGPAGHLGRDCPWALPSLCRVQIWGVGCRVSGSWMRCDLAPTKPWTCPAPPARDGWVTDFCLYDHVRHLLWLSRTPPEPPASHSTPSTAPPRCTPTSPPPSGPLRAVPRPAATPQRHATTRRAHATPASPVSRHPPASSRS